MCYKDGGGVRQARELRCALWLYGVALGWLPGQESRIRGSRAVIVIVTVVTYNGCVLGTALRALNC